MPNTPTIPADPSVVARRVLAVEQLIQLSGSFETFPTAEDEDPKAPLHAEYAQAAPGALLVEPTRLVVRMGYRCAIGTQRSETFLKSASPAAQSPPPGTRFFAAAEFAVVYQLSPGDAPTGDQLLAFAMVNTPLNLTPYWREFLDSCARRAGLPSVLAPVHKAEPLLPRGPKQ